MSPNDWTPEQNQAVVRIYFEMLREQQCGHDFTKADFRRQLEKETGRSKASVEFKLCNISAVLEEMGLMFIVGYKPYPHYQQALKDEVTAYLNLLL